MKLPDFDYNRGVERLHSPEAVRQEGKLQEVEAKTGVMLHAVKTVSEVVDRNLDSTARVEAIEKQVAIDAERKIARDKLRVEFSDPNNNAPADSYLTRIKELDSEIVRRNSTNVGGRTQRYLSPYLAQVRANDMLDRDLAWQNDIANQRTELTMQKTAATMGAAVRASPYEMQSHLETIGTLMSTAQFSSPETRANTNRLMHRTVYDNAINSLAEEGDYTAIDKMVTSGTLDQYYNPDEIRMVGDLVTKMAVSAVDDDSNTLVSNVVLGNLTPQAAMAEYDKTLGTVPGLGKIERADAAQKFEGLMTNAEFTGLLANRNFDTAAQKLTNDERFKRHVDVAEGLAKIQGARDSYASQQYVGMSLSGDAAIYKAGQTGQPSEGWAAQATAALQSGTLREGQDVRLQRQLTAYRLSLDGYNREKGYANLSDSELTAESLKWSNSDSVKAAVPAEAWDAGTAELYTASFSGSGVMARKHLEARTTQPGEYYRVSSPERTQQWVGVEDSMARALTSGDPADVEAFQAQLKTWQTDVVADRVSKLAPEVAANLPSDYYRTVPTFPTGSRSFTNMSGMLNTGTRQQQFQAAAQLAHVLGPEMAPQLTPQLTKDLGLQMTVTAMSAGRPDISEGLINGAAKESALKIAPEVKKQFAAALRSEYGDLYDLFGDKAKSIEAAAFTLYVNGAPEAALVSSTSEVDAKQVAGAMIALAGKPITPSVYGGATLPYFNDKTHTYATEDEMMSKVCYLRSQPSLAPPILDDNNQPIDLGAAIDRGRLRMISNGVYELDLAVSPTLTRYARTTNGGRWQIDLRTMQPPPPTKGSLFEHGIR